MTPYDAYQKLTQRMKELSYVGGACALLSWDEETYLPEKGRSYRAEQKAFLSGWSHERFVDPEVGKWLEICSEASDSLGSEQKVNVREWRRDYQRSTALTKEMVEEFEQARSETHHLWVEARKESDFSKFAPGLKRLLDLSKKRADAWGYEESPYDALLEEYEPGMRVRQLIPVFDDLKKELTPIIPMAVEKSLSLKTDFPVAEYPIELQQKLNAWVAEKIGFDLSAGRIDTTVHPFCSGIASGDCRLTTRYASDQFLTSLYGVMHEAGHGMYEQGLIDEGFSTPMGQALSLGIHESQSRFWENHVGRSRAFWEFLYPKVVETFPHLKGVSLDQMLARVNHVEPSYIRVEADPVTYDLHIILRFEVEQKLFSGAISIDEVPDYWNATFETLMGLKVKDEASGALQDVHWSWGLFGYFPTYTLGNLNAAQLYKAMEKDLGSLDAKMSHGNFAPILSWLQEKIHRQGKRLNPIELMQSATGAPTNAKSHIAYLTQKFA
jgi:carboxypeptidase Taq